MWLTCARFSVGAALGVGLLGCSGLLVGGNTDPLPPWYWYEYGYTPTTNDTARPGDGPPLPDPGLPTTDSGAADGFPAEYVLLSAEFGWDNAQRRVVNPLVGGYEVVNRISFVVATQAFLYAADPFAETDEYCVVDLIFPEGPANESARSVGDPTLYFAVDHSGLAADFVTTCGDAAHDVGDLFGADIAAYFLLGSAEPWGMGVGPVSEEMIAIFEDAGLSPDEWSLVVGGTVYNTSTYWGPAAHDDAWYVVPIRLDDDFSAQTNGYYFDLLDPQDVPAGARVSTGWYRFYTWSAIDLGRTY